MRGVQFVPIGIDEICYFLNVLEYCLSQMVAYITSLQVPLQFLPSFTFTKTYLNSLQHNM